MGTTTKPNKVTPIQPGEHLDYDFRVQPWLDAHIPPDEIVSAEVTYDGTALQLDTIVVTPKNVKQWVTGITEEPKNKLECTVLTVAGRIKEIEMNIPCKEK